MLAKREFRVYLQDMLENAQRGIAFIHELTYDEFLQDEKTQYALIRAIELIGEAGTKIPAAIKDKIPGIPWREVSGIRNKLIHDYFGINLEVVWRTGKEDLSLLIPELQNAIKLTETFRE